MSAVDCRCTKFCLFLTVISIALHSCSITSCDFIVKTLLQYFYSGKARGSSGSLKEESSSGMAPNLSIISFDFVVETLLQNIYSGKARGSSGSFIEGRRLRIK